jgi:ketosteroid isomerase-like protein
MIAAFVVSLLFFAADLRTELSSLIDTERAFAATSVAKGTRDAFLANLSDESIIFRPTAVRGKAWFEGRPAVAGSLSWEPEFADIAASGDLGYTTGPYENRPQGQSSSFGHYVTLWKKQPDGRWKIAVDYGISHSQTVKPSNVGSPKLPNAVAQARSPQEIQASRNSLLGAEKAFPTTSTQYGGNIRCCEDARLYRDGQLPLTVYRDIREALIAMKGSFKWEVQGSDVSSSADFGYTYGTVEFKPSETGKAAQKGNFVRVWKKRGDSWRVTLDLVN